MDFKYAWMNMSGLEWVVGLLSILVKLVRVVEQQYYWYAPK